MFLWDFSELVNLFEEKNKNMKLRLFISTMAVLFVFSTFAKAQEEIHRAEFYAGYSFLRTDTEDFNGDRVNAHGFNGSITGNFHRYVGAKFDFSTHSKSFEDIVVGTTPVEVKLRLNQFLGGVQFKDNKIGGGRLKPFAHVLAGIANLRARASATTTASDSESHFAMAVGGGLDVRASKRVDIRVFQVDYNPIFADGDRSNNFRFGFGIVIH